MAREEGHTHTHTHTHTLERNPGKTRKNAKLKNAGPTEITEASRQTAGAPTGGIRLQTSKRLPYQKIGSTLAPSLAHTFGASSHMLAAPLRSSTQHGTAYAASGTGPTPAIRGRGDAMAGADQSANDPELELSREKKLPVVGDRQKQLIYRGAATPKPDCVARRPTRKDENERKSAVPTALRRQEEAAKPPPQPRDVQGCIEAVSRTRLYQRRYEAHFAKNITI